MFLYPLLDYCISVKCNRWDQGLTYQIELYGGGVALQCRHPLPLSLIKQGSFKLEWFICNGPFTVVVLGYLAMDASEAGGDLALTQTSLLFSFKCQLVSIRTTWCKSSKVCVKTRSPPASLPFRGQVTKHTTVKWFALKCIWNNWYLNCGGRWKWRMIIVVNFPIKAIGKKKQKNSRPQRDSNPWPPRNTGAMPFYVYQLSYEATNWERGQFIEFISSRPVRSEMMWSVWNNWCLNCGSRRKWRNFFPIA